LEKKKEEVTGSFWPICSSPEAQPNPGAAQPNYPQVIVFLPSDKQLGGGLSVVNACEEMAAAAVALPRG
jgi:hypothetical protein